MSRPTIFRVDAFTDRAFAGNAAAVCLLEAPAETRWLQALAREMNAAATAFVSPGSDVLSEMLAYQASARGGVLRVCPRGTRILLGGRAVTVARAVLG